MKIRLGRRSTDPMVEVPQALNPTRPIGVEERAEIAALDAEYRTHQYAIEDLDTVLEQLHRVSPGVSYAALQRFADRIRAARAVRRDVA